MRAIVFGLMALALAACGQKPEVVAQGAGCALSAEHALRFSTDTADDVITARADGPTCDQAVVTLVVRNAEGDPLWAFASTYNDMVRGGAPVEGAEPVSSEAVQTFLTGWADFTTMRSGELPEWREDAESLSASVQELSYDTPFGREAYEMLRGRNLATICYAASMESSQCLIIDPMSQSTTMIVAFGP
ncbi:MAG: hypothetical protein WDM79_08895 [Terricaulis sp.]